MVNLLGGSGGHTWLYSNQQLRGAARVLPERRLDGDLTREVEDLRARTLVGSHAGRPKPSQMMNLHQTKSREADATVLLLHSDELHGYEARGVPHWVAASVRLPDQGTRARAHRRA